MPPVVDPTQQALHVLYRDHHDWLRGWLRRKLGNTPDAADLTQDTFVRVLASPTAAPAIQQPRAYLTTIAKGLLINWYQRQALERAYSEALALMPEALMPSEEQRLIIVQTLHEIDAMLDALPPPVKRAFLLSQIEGMRYEDIATHMGVALVTIKRYMRQAFLQCLTVME